MSITRTLLTSFALLPLLAACQAYTGKAEGPPPATRLQGQISLAGEHLIFTPCQEQRRFQLVDAGSDGLVEDIAQRADGAEAGLFADLAGQLGGSQGQDLDGRLAVSQLYRVQAEGHGCDDLNFKRLTLRASGHEPFWQVEVGRQGLVLRRPGEEPLALPYLEEQLPEGRLNFSSEANGHRLELWLAPQRCIDSMSGALHHLSAELRLDGQVQRGCAHFGGARD